MIRFDHNIDAKSQILATAYRDVIKSHDLKEYDRLEKSSMLLLQNLGVPDVMIREVASTICQMYRISDEADRNLELGRSLIHDEYFGRIARLASDLDAQLGIERGSICDEIKWWYHYRLSRTSILGKKPTKFAKVHFLLAFFFMFLEHLKRLRSPFALQCTLWLILVGRKHEKRDWIAVHRLLKKYWIAKIAGNHWRVEPKLVLL